MLRFLFFVSILVAQVAWAPKAYSVDLRWSVIRQYVIFGKNIEEVAQLNGIDARTVKKYVSIFENTKNVLSKWELLSPWEKSIKKGRNPIITPFCIENMFICFVFFVIQQNI